MVSEDTMYLFIGAVWKMPRPPEALGATGLNHRGSRYVDRLWIVYEVNSPNHSAEFPACPDSSYTLTQSMY